MANLNQEKQTTILDLNMDVLDEIFQELVCLKDKVNLAKAHPHLTNAFAHHGRFNFKAITINDHHSYKNYDEEYIIKNSGESVQFIEIYNLKTFNLMQLIAENCINLYKVNIRSPIYFRPRYDMMKIIDFLKQFKSLRKLELGKNEHINIDFIRTILTVLDKNGVTPDNPFELVLDMNQTSVDNLSAEISLCDKSHLLILKCKRKFKPICRLYHDSVFLNELNCQDLLPCKKNFDLDNM